QLVDRAAFDEKVVRRAVRADGGVFPAQILDRSSRRDRREGRVSLLNFGSTASGATTTVSVATANHRGEESNAQQKPKLACRSSLHFDRSPAGISRSQPQARSYHRRISRIKYQSRLRAYRFTIATPNLPRSINAIPPVARRQGAQGGWCADCSGWPLRRCSMRPPVMHHPSSNEAGACRARRLAGRSNIATATWVLIAVLLLCAFSSNADAQTAARKF